MFDKVIQDIKDFNITGAEQITLWGVRAFSYKKAELDDTCQFISTYLIHLSKAKKALYESRKNEFSLHNALNYIFDKKRYSKSQTLEEVQKDISTRLRTIEKHLEEALIRVSSIGDKKIKQSMHIATIGHSTFVSEILCKATEKKRYSLAVFQGGAEEKGKDLALELPKKQKIHYYSDGMSSEVLQHTDMVILGATGINAKGECITQPGARSLVELAKTYKVPVYIATDSLKFGEDNIVKEEKPLEELWVNEPKNVIVRNSTVSIIDPKYITGIICEKGIFTTKEFITEAKKSFF